MKQTSELGRKQPRIEYLDIAKAICIVLVVIGHFNPSTAPEGWFTAVNVIYTFHMPLFMFVSGFLFSKTYRPQPYLEFVSRKFKHLMVPYLLTSVFIIGIKLTMQGILPVKNTAQVQDFLTMLYRPSAAVHLWFIWALMLLYLIAPLCRRKYAGIAFLAFATVLWLLPINLPDIFSLNHFKANAVFFATGLVTGSFELNPKHRKNLSPIIIMLFAVLEYLYANGVARPVLKIILPFAGILFILTVSSLLSDTVKGKARAILLFVGQSSLIIFLLHSAFGEFGKAVLSIAGITPGNHFTVSLLTFVLLGVCGPLLLKIIFVLKPFSIPPKT